MLKRHLATLRAYPELIALLLVGVVACSIGIVTLLITGSEVSKLLGLIDIITGIGTLLLYSLLINHPLSSSLRWIFVVFLYSCALIACTQLTNPSSQLIAVTVPTSIALVMVSNYKPIIFLHCILFFTSILFFSKYADYRLGIFEAVATHSVLYTCIYILLRQTFKLGKKVAQEGYTRNVLSFFNHEIRNIAESLNGLMMAYEHVDKNIGITRAEIDAAMLDNVQHMNSLARTLLILGSGNKRYQLNKTLVDPDQSITTLATEIRASLQRHELPITLIVDTTPLTIYGDAVLIATAIRTALLNSRQALEPLILTTNTSQTIWLRSYMDHHWAVIEVRDDGKGFSAAYLQAFTTATAGYELIGLSSKQGGGGIGMAVIYSIVQQHGGYVKVFNDAGAVIQMFLPLEQQ